MLSYETAKKLKEAGWPQGDYSSGPARFLYPGEWPDTPVLFWSKEEKEKLAYSPSLSELIARSGDGFLTLCRVKYSGGVLWQAWGSGAEDDFRVDGATPEEAVANLWLKLKEQSVPLPATG